MSVALFRPSKMVARRTQFGIFAGIVIVLAFIMSALSIAVLQQYEDNPDIPNSSARRSVITANYVALGLFGLAFFLSLVYVFRRPSRTVASYKVDSDAAADIRKQRQVEEDRGRFRSTG